MKIQLLSDLHLETPKAYDIYEITPTAPCLALLGDIGCICDPGYLTFLNAQLKQFKIVFHVLGNHEPYGSSWGSVTAKLHKFQEKNQRQRVANPGLGEYILLDQNEHHLPEHNTTVLGCTLFSNIPQTSLKDVSFGLNDFFRIDSWTVEDHVSAHIRDLTWLNSRVTALFQEEPGRKIIIFTHHSPTLDLRTVNPRTAGNKTSSGFATDLSGEPCWIGENVVFWAYGHTHYNFPLWRDQDSGIFVYRNQRGYYFSQASGFAGTEAVNIGRDGKVTAEEWTDEPASPAILAPDPRRGDHGST
ncbi:calcineurin-like phosphoesterase [Diaporthe helianthi]|uniref:Calcineurin-like phosphoesterase n=1 Tax=Diaporthe helianthi TaxID=158607 RepID=A0A2P5HJF5_DIAHE|nr:calcineurin-like phosphoesterase [Diaporthe helianthi]